MLGLQGDQMLVRKFHSSDAYSLWQLQFQTIREVCLKDYSQLQVAAWAPDVYQPQTWLARMISHDPFIVEIDNNIAGYADIQADGYIDHFYCSKHYIGKGVGGCLMRHILSQAKANKVSRLYAQVSITAKPFFQHFGFKVIKIQTVNVRGVDLQNYVMERITDTYRKGCD